VQRLTAAAPQLDNRVLDAQIVKGAPLKEIVAANQAVPWEVLSNNMGHVFYLSARGKKKRKGST
jgi:hypothetical protein